MANPLFTVPVADVERSEQHRSWSIPEQWLSEQLADTEAQPTSEPGQLTVSLSKQGAAFLVQGQIRVQVRLPCARTLEPAIYDLSPQLFLLLTQCGPAPRTTRSERHKSPKQQRREESDRWLTDEDAAHETFSGETILLDDFVREQIVLELPMFPVRSDLRSAHAPAIRPPSEISTSASTLDPRLAPLAALAERLKTEK